MDNLFNDIRTLSYYTSGNVFAGSIGSFRYRIAKRDDCFTVCVWNKDCCYELAEIIAQEEFPLTEEGLENIKDWLKRQFED